MFKFVRHALVLTLLTGTVASLFGASAQEVQAEFIRDANGVGRIEFRIGQENPSEDDVAAWVAQQKASAPKQISAPKKVQALAPRAISESYFVQAASMTDAQGAQAILDQLGEGQIESAMVRGTQYHRVLIGPFEKQSEAKLAVNSVVKAGFSDAFVRG